MGSPVMHPKALGTCWLGQHATSILGARQVPGPVVPRTCLPTAWCCFCGNPESAGYTEFDVTGAWYRSKPLSLPWSHDLLHAPYLMQVPGTLAQPAVSLGLPGAPHTLPRLVIPYASCPMPRLYCKCLDSWPACFLVLNFETCVLGIAGVPPSAQSTAYSPLVCTEPGLHAAASYKLLLPCSSI